MGWDTGEGWRGFGSWVGLGGGRAIPLVRPACRPCPLATHLYAPSNPLPTHQTPRLFQTTLSSREEKCPTWKLKPTSGGMWSSGAMLIWASCPLGTHLYAPKQSLAHPPTAQTLHCSAMPPPLYTVRASQAAPAPTHWRNRSYTNFATFPAYILIYHIRGNAFYLEQYISGRVYPNLNNVVMFRPRPFQSSRWDIIARIKLSFGIIMMLLWWRNQDCISKKVQEGFTKNDNGNQNNKGEDFVKDGDNGLG